MYSLAKTIENKKNWTLSFFADLCLPLHTSPACLFYTFLCTSKLFQCFEWGKKVRNLWNAQNCFPECLRTRFRGQAKLSANAGKETYTATSVTIKIIAREDFNRSRQRFSAPSISQNPFRSGCVTFQIQNLEIWVFNCCWIWYLILLVCSVPKCCSILKMSLFGFVKSLYASDFMLWAAGVGGLWNGGWMEMKWKPWEDRIGVSAQQSTKPQTYTFSKAQFGFLFFSDFNTQCFSSERK